MQLKTIGAILLAGTVLAAMAMQVSGRGLVTTRLSTAPPRVTPGPDGSTLVRVEGQAIVFHLNRIVPITGVAILGLVCLRLSSRDETKPKPAAQS